MWSSSHAVRVRDVVKTFGKVTALDGVSLEFEEGMVYALLGPNGAGKTTLIRVLTTLIEPDSGTVEVAGVDAAKDPVGVRAAIGLAGQFAAVDDYLTGRENLRMVGKLYNLSSKEARRRADEVLERIHLTEASDRQVGTYSGGMRRRLDIAASLVGRPRILFLDEPTTGVDPRSRLDLWHLIEELVRDGTTVLLTTQYLEEADQLSDRIGVIDRGRLVTEGTADELKAALGGDMIELTVEEAAVAEAAEAVRAVIDGPVEIEMPVIRVAAPNGADSLTAVVKALDARDVHPIDLSLRRPTLDEVFLALTGEGPSGVRDRAA
ncbi:MAG TPA: ATP-binding cassette domain-containing protein [Acidimicrobiia bacterium]|jgi:ABC-2 type transport system ATP-binding protein